MYILAGGLSPFLFFLIGIKRTILLLLTSTILLINFLIFSREETYEILLFALKESIDSLTDIEVSNSNKISVKTTCAGLSKN